MFLQWTSIWVVLNGPIDDFSDRFGKFRLWGFQTVPGSSIKFINHWDNWIQSEVPKNKSIKNDKMVMSQNTFDWLFNWENVFQSMVTLIKLLCCPHESEGAQESEDEGSYHHTA